jgi:hypothetical protein
VTAPVVGADTADTDAPVMFIPVHDSIPETRSGSVDEALAKRLVPDEFRAIVQPLDVLSWDVVDTGDRCLAGRYPSDRAIPCGKASDTCMTNHVRDCVPPRPIRARTAAPG